MGVVRSFLCWIFFPWRSAAKWKSVAKFFRRQAESELAGTWKLYQALKATAEEKHKVQLECEFYKTLLTKTAVVMRDHQNVN